jgi:hypothetical protein
MSIKRCEGAGIINIINKLNKQASAKYFYQIGGNEAFCYKGSHWQFKALTTCSRMLDFLLVCTATLPYAETCIDCARISVAGLYLKIYLNGVAVTPSCVMNDSRISRVCTVVHSLNYVLNRYM